MGVIVDSENIVNSLEQAPDRLRAEIGRYYTTAVDGEFGIATFTSGVEKVYVDTSLELGQQLIPTKRARIFVRGREEQFRDQIQWNQHIKNTIRTNQSFLDHQFQFEHPKIASELIKNYHHAKYEDQTKTHETNQLLNWNLVSYRYKDELPSVQKVGDIKTQFDDEFYIINSSVHWVN